MTDAAPFALLKRNPDVLTCIANLSNDEVFTPPEFAGQMLDAVAEGWAATNGGANLWADSTARFLDPCTKSGVFLREIARRLIEGLEGEIPELQARVDHILTMQLFGVGITRLTALLARRSLYCSKWANGEHSVATEFDDEDGNIWFERTEHDWQGNKCRFCSAPRAIFGRSEDFETHAYAFIHTDDPRARLAEMFGDDMQFDVIIGNPPYQLAGGGGGTNDSAIYHLFVEQALKLEPRFLSMVIPSRWMAGGRGMDDFRQMMLTDRHISHLVDYPNSGQVFPGVDLKSGVCFFLRNSGYEGDCEVTLVRDETIGPTRRRLDEHDVFIRDERAAAILKKVLDRGEPSFSSLLTGDTPFGLATNFSDFRPAEPRDGEVKVYASSNLGRRSGAMARATITKNTHLIDAWKVLTPQAGPGSSGGHIIPDMVLGRPSTAEPNSVCTQTWIVAGPLNSKEEADSAASYLTTRFARFIVSLRKISQHAMRGVYQWLPQQTWDRIWTDAQLYEKYGIASDEQAFIESMIRPMEPAD
jgi:site-specific DNA-methyltransferase (adenine-specific)